jgi:hypothetical protein
MQADSERPQARYPSVMKDRSRFSIIPIGSLHSGWALKIDSVIRCSSPSLISLGAYVDAIMAAPTRLRGSRRATRS